MCRDGGSETARLRQSTSTEGRTVRVRGALCATLQPRGALSKSLPRAGAAAGRAVRMRGSGPAVPRADEYAGGAFAHAGCGGNLSEARACERSWPGCQNSAVRKLHVFVFKPRWFK